MAHLNLISSNYMRNFICSSRRIVFNNVRQLNISKLEEKQDDLLIENDPDETSAQEERINKIRNKSRLLDQHRNVLHGNLPYPETEEPIHWSHESLKYKRKLYGKYGSASGIDPRICFSTKKELHVRQEYEKVAFPHTLEDMKKLNEQQKREKLEAIMKREEKIAKNLEKLETWKSDLHNKIAKKEAEAQAAKDRKDRLVEEVRRHFGFKVDARDERFKELLEQKEKEDKKQMKEAKRKAKEEKMLAKLIEPKSEKPAEAKPEQ